MEIEYKKKGIKMIEDRFEPVRQPPKELHSLGIIKDIS